MELDQDLEYKVKEIIILAIKVTDQLLCILAFNKNIIWSKACLTRVDSPLATSNPPSYHLKHEFTLNQPSSNIRGTHVCVKAYDSPKIEETR